VKQGEKMIDNSEIYVKLPKLSQSYKKFITFLQKCRKLIFTIAEKSVMIYEYQYVTIKSGGI